MSIKKQVRGVRVSMPTGFLLGRTDAGVGPAHLISLNEVGQKLVASGSVAANQAATKDLILSLYVPGPFTTGQEFTIPPAPHSFGTVAVFPDANNPDTVTCVGVPAGNITFYLVDNINAFLGLGAPNGVFATITFSAGQSVGAIAYSGDEISPAEVLTLVMPSPADASFLGFTLVIHGGIST